MNKWINWTSILTTLALAALTGTGVWLKSSYGEYKGMISTVHTHVATEAQRSEQMQRQQVLLEKIDRDVSDVKAMTMTVMGFAKVQPDGGDEASCLVNVNGRAMMYKSEVRVRVTNMQSQEQESVLVKINGTFSMPDENKILMLSKKAGAKLSLLPNQVARVKLEPVVEEKK